MERYILYTVKIVQQGQRELFQIRIPRTTKSVTGVKVTTDFQIDDYQELNAGSLWLSLPVVREAFFAQVVQAFNPMHDWAGYTGLMSVNFRDGFPWTCGTKEEFQSVNVPVYQTIIEGYYANQHPSSAVYSVTIYLRLEV